jgi:hypothetical protein
MKTEDFYKLVEPMRDLSVWEKLDDGSWKPKDSITRHEIGASEEEARVTQSEDRTFAPHNKHLYYNEASPPEKLGDPRLDEFPKKFQIL